MIKKFAIAFAVLTTVSSITFANSKYIPDFSGDWDGVCSSDDPALPSYANKLQISQYYIQLGEVDIVIDDESYSPGEFQTDSHSNVKTGHSTNEIKYTDWNTDKKELIISSVTASKLKDELKLSVKHDERTMKLDGEKLIVTLKSEDAGDKTVSCVYTKTKT